MTREPLPSRRPAESFDFEHENISYRVTLGFYTDGRLGECFMAAQRDGTQIDVAARDESVLLSLLLQHGASFKNLRKSMTREPDGSASSPIGKLLDILCEG
jgi:hypothetical protein